MTHFGQNSRPGESDPYVSLIILCQFEGCGFLRQDRTEKAVRYFQFREWSFNTGGQTHSPIESECGPLHLQVSY